MDTTPALTIVRSARKGATTDHLAFSTGWSSVPLCGAMKTGKRIFPGGDANCTPCITEANRQCLDIEGLVRISARTRDLITTVREHAMANYNTGAWDIIVEAYSDSELAGTVGKCRTAAGAIRKVAAIVELYADRRAPHDAEIRMATETTTFSDPVAPEVPSEYDRFADGSHPDGSWVFWSWDRISGESWATRTWLGKTCRGLITVKQVGPDGDYVTMERYIPAWSGAVIESPDLCHGLPF